MTISRKVRKAIIPAAGLGTRFLPATKSQPKEMLPIVDKPAIQYVVEEAIGAGITDILVITGRGKRAIEDHFDRNFELEFYLERAEKDGLLREVQAISQMTEIHYIRQRDPLGLGHAVAVGRQHVGDEPFAVLLGDDIMTDDSLLLRSMMESYEGDGCSVVAVQEVPNDEISSYGCIEPAASSNGSSTTSQPPGGVVGIRSIVEKPQSKDAPSNLAVIGRYVFTPEIFDALARVKPGAGGELQLTDGIAILLESQTVNGYIFTHGRYDIGQKLDFLRATVEIALDRPDLGPDFAVFLTNLVKQRGLI